MTTILLVDDDPLQAYLTMSLLGRRFAYVRRATDAAEALCLIEQPDFARHLGLVISGQHTHSINGPEFVAELRTRLPHVPVLVLGARTESPTDYAEQNVTFLPRNLVGDKMITLSSQLMNGQKSEVA